ncbi:MAG: acyl-[ACP]--phospholipid O-acyltransferase [Rhodospirillaceae bacterium]|nr:acyl-[ACP]--phospholipid O-acyltransferase [Rhodospirillaceae bacterium]
MSESQTYLLTTKRFLPLFVTQALGALNDNLFKNALALLIIYRIAEAAEIDGQVMVTVAAGLFILPFFLFSATAGQIADKFEKSRLIRTIKLAEVAIMGLGAAGLIFGNVTYLMSVLFLMGMQSAFFGPVKYSILPDHLSEDELIGGNGLIEAGTFLAILIGTIAGGLLILQDSGTLIVAAGVVLVALAGLASSFAIPNAPAPAPDMKLNPNVLAETWSIVRKAREQRGIFLSILGISWFWLVGATFLAQFPAFAKDVLGGDETVVTLFLTLFSVGIGVGSLLCNRLLNGEVTARYVPLAAIGMTVFIADLFFASNGRVPAAELTGAVSVVSTAANWRIVFDLLAIAVCGGLFIVPLYAILQSRSEEAFRSRIIAANNILNALFMVAGAAAAALLLTLGFSVPAIFLALAIGNGIVAIYVCGLLPDALIKGLVISLLKLLYRVEIKGMEHYAQAGKRAVIVVNHISFLDAIILAAFLPIKPMFAVNTHIAQHWWMKPLLRFVDFFAVDPTNPMSTKGLIKAVKKDRHCVIFPEGRITVTGALMKVYEGPGMIADKADAMLVPIRIDGAQYTPFSRVKDKVRIRWFPKITMTVLPPRRFEIPAEIVGRERRQLAGTKLYDVMSQMIFETEDCDRTLFQALLDAQAVHGRKHPIAEDIERKPIGYGRLVTGALVLGRKLAAMTPADRPVGYLLPNSVGGVVTFFALQAFGRVPAMLNFSTGSKNMLAALTAAQIDTVVTSRRFIALGNLEEAVAALAEQAEIIYLEDLRQEIGLLDKLAGLFSRHFAHAVHDGHATSPDEAAVILFTSGSEGTPKGVVLSHANLLANRHQLAARIDFNPTDIVFNALPIFHSFGLTGGTLLPVLSGVKTFLYPSPLHYRIVPALVYDTNATIMFGTDTFLTGYAKVAHPYDFYSLRYVFAGAEKVKDETRRVWSDKFGLRVLEGYGATETAPVIAANTPMHYKAGTVGRTMPGITCELEPVPGIDEGGKLVVTGPNVMLGYLRAENPGVLEATENNRYDTGDIVTIDQEGFITIQGRAKRFAKIAGEMVSLTAVEALAAAVWPDHMHAAVSIPDARKGEQIVLLTENPDADRAALSEQARAEGLSELAVPATVRPVDAIPVLGTGKVDYVGIGEMITEAA